MTETVVLASELDEYARPRVEMVLISRMCNTSKMMHLKRADDPEHPVCGAQTKHPNGWREINEVVGPYFPFCSECAETQFGIEVVRDD